MGTGVWYRVEIAPLVTMSFDRSPLFSYASATSIPPGSLMTVSFGRRQVLGVVFKSLKITAIPIPSWMKKTGSLEFPHYLTESQLLLAQYLSSSTFTPLGICLKHFIVPRSRAKISPSASQSTYKSLPVPPLSPAEMKTALALSKGKKLPKIFFAPYNASSKNSILSLLQSKISSKQQVLFLVPELFLVEWWHEELDQYFPTGVLTVIHSHLKGSDLATAWQNVRTGQALFAPFSTLSTIIISDEEDQTSYKQWEMSPRYTVRSFADELTRIWRANLILFTPTPSLGTQHAIKERAIHKITGPLPMKRGPVQLTNMRFEKKMHGRSVLSQDLLSVLGQTLSHNHKAFFVTKQRGWSSFSICRHCRCVLRCPQCEKALHGDREGRYKCHSCGYRTGLFPRCRACQEMTFLNFGAGTERIEREIHAHFPNARVLRIDIERGKSKEAPRILQMIRNGEYDVLIGTSAHVKIPNLPSTGLIAMIEADSTLAFPDYQAEERLLRDVERLRLLSGAAEGTLLIQTFEPEQEIYSSVLKGDYFDQGKDLLSERFALQYPPYAHFIKIECRDKTLAGSKKVAERLEEDLTRLITSEHLEIRITPHHLPLVSTRQKYYQIFLRILSTQTIPPSLKSLLTRYAKKCIYDIDPLTLR